MRVTEFLKSLIQETFPGVGGKMGGGLEPTHWQVYQVTGKSKLEHATIKYILIKWWSFLGKKKTCCGCPLPFPVLPQPQIHL